MDEDIAEQLDAQALDTAKFFFVAKPSSKEKPEVDGVSHETVKPIALMEKLAKLITPENKVVLDPFSGSGTTLEATMIHKFDAIRIEREDKYIPLIKSRLERSSIFTEIIFSNE